MIFLDMIANDIEKACIHDALEFLELYVKKGMVCSKVVKKAGVVSAYAGGFVKKYVLLKVIDLGVFFFRRPNMGERVLSVREAQRFIKVLRGLYV